MGTLNFFPLSHARDKMKNIFPQYITMLIVTHKILKEVTTVVFHKSLKFKKKKK